MASGSNTAAARPTTFDDLPAAFKMDIYKRMSYMNCHANCTVCGTEFHKRDLRRCIYCSKKVCRNDLRMAVVGCENCWEDDEQTEPEPTCRNCFFDPYCPLCHRRKLCIRCDRKMVDECFYLPSMYVHYTSVRVYDEHTNMCDDCVSNAHEDLEDQWDAAPFVED